MKLKKGDQILVCRGKDRGRKGKIEKIFPQKQQVLVAGVNLYKKHVRPQGEGQPGGVVEVVKPLPVASVKLICPQCKKPTRVGWQQTKTGEKSRLCKKCQAVI